MKKLRAASVISIIAVLAALLGTGAAASAQDAQPGACQVVPSANGGHTIEISDLANSTKRIALRLDGKFSTILSSDTTSFDVPGNTGYSIRAFPTNGNPRYELPCTPAPADAGTCTFTTTPSAVNLDFPNFDAKRIVVRRNNVWQATLDGAASQWTDRNPAPGASYLLRVTQNDGTRTDIACVGAGQDAQGLRELLANGSFRPGAFTGQTAFTTTSFIGTGPITGNNFSSEISGDGSVATLLDGSLYRLSLETSEVQRINGGVFTSAISDDGSVIAYVRRGKLRIWNVDANRASGFKDRSVIVDPSINRLTVAGDGGHVFYYSGDDDQYYRYTIATGEQLPVPGRAGRGSVSDDGSRYLDLDAGDVVNLDTGERISIFDEDRPAMAKISGDGTTVAISRNLFIFDSAVDLVNIDTGARRQFELVGNSDQVILLNDDATRVLLADDEFEQFYIHDLTTNTVEEATEFIGPNDREFDDDFARAMAGSFLNEAR